MVKSLEALLNTEAMFGVTAFGINPP